MTTSDLKEKLSATAEKARQAAASALDVAAEAGRSLKAEVSAQGADGLSSIRQAVEGKAGEARDTLIHAADRLAEKLETEAQASEGMPQRLLSGIAGGMTSVTDGLRGRSAGDLLAEAKSYASRHPGTFAVAAALAGFALARFLRSSGDGRQAAARAAETTDRLYRDAAQHTVETMGGARSNGAVK